MSSSMPALPFKQRQNLIPLNPREEILIISNVPEKVWKKKKLGCITIEKL